MSVYDGIYDRVDYTSRIAEPEHKVHHRSRYLAQLLTESRDNIYYKERCPAYNKSKEDKS